MITNHENGDSKKGEYLYSKVHYTSEYKYTYVWYEQNGVKRMETKKEKLVEPRTVTSAKTKAVTNSSPTKVRPGNIPTLPSSLPATAKEGYATTQAAQTFSQQKVVDAVKKAATTPQPPPPATAAPKTDSLSLTKYEYQYGLKNLEIKHTQYANKSIYVSTPIQVAGNVMSVSLKATEEHPLFDGLNGKAADRQTSIEYYIASVGMNPNPTLDEWLPILPEGQKEVRSELLLFGTARTAELRFPALIGAKSSPIVYKNGLAMEADEWSFIDGGIGMQLLVEKDPTAMYTIDYTPNAEFYNPWNVDVNQATLKPISHTQVFEHGTNHNKTIVLEKYPYINYEKINMTENYDPNLSDYVPIQVRLQDASIIGPSRVTYKEVPAYNGGSQYVYTKNVTDYKTGTHEPLTAYSIDTETAYNGFDYYHEGDKLVFSQTFNKADIYINDQDSHGNATIVVDYEYLSSDFRMKIILRRNSTDENTLTPIVHDYTLKFKVMK